MRWDLLPDISAFDSARRKEAYRRLSRAVRREEHLGLLDLDEVRERLGAFEESYDGIIAVPVGRIVGTAGRAGDFDRDFLPLDERIRERWRRVEQAFPRGDFPPIAAYEISGSYFVVDGHHRVAVAKQRGVDYVDAEVTRLRPRHPLPEGADLGKLILAEQELLFMAGTGLDRSRPAARMELSRSPGYAELFELVEVHGYRLCRERGEVVPIEDVAADWYDRVYGPATEILRREGLPDMFPESTEADLFLWVHQRRRAASSGRGETTVEEAARRARDERGD